MLAAEESAVPKRRRTHKIYTPAEKVAFIVEIQRQQRTESLSIEHIARQLGISDASYYNWLRAGLRAPDSMPTAPTAMSPTNKTMAAPLRAKAARRYDVQQRAALLAKVASRREAGERLAAILKSLDLAHTTYARWLERESPAPAFRAVFVEDSPSALAPVVTSVALIPAPAITTPSSPAPLSLVAPGGYRIEGLGVESAAALLRALA